MGWFLTHKPAPPFTAKSKKVSVGHIQGYQYITAYPPFIRKLYIAPKSFPTGCLPEKVWEIPVLYNSNLHFCNQSGLTNGEYPLQ